MALVCPHCSRTNSADAQFCHFDGVSLYKNGHAPSDVQLHSFPTPFVFPSGPACKNFDDFARACVTHWDAAVDLLQRGVVRAFFNGIGRMDLVEAAQEAENYPDRDRGLDLLLGRLPTHAVPPPKLDVTPKLTTIGPLKVGMNGRLEFTLDNRGNRFIFGSIASNAKWLAVTDTGDARLFQIRQSSKIVVQVKGQHLRAGKSLEATLTIDSNAGPFKLKVIADVPIVAFPEGVLAGARTPRELAEKAKASPKQAAPLFQSGAVAKWYQSNGWIYPVQGPAATGMAALQQFFEALGLSKPPKVRLSEAKITVAGKPGTKIAVRLQAHGDESRPVFAHAVSSAPWLAVKPALLQGTTATLLFEITVPDSTMQTTLSIQANGNQRFEVPVEVAVESKAVVAAPPYQPEAPARIAPAHSSLALRAGVLMHVAPLLLLGFFVFGLVVKDSFSKHPKQVAIHDEPQEEKHQLRAAEFKVAIQDEPDDLPTVVPVARFKIEDEPEERFLKLPPPPVKFEIKDEPDEIAPGKPGKGATIDPTLRIAYTPRGLVWGMTDALTGKQLTYSANGATNRTSVRVGGLSRGLFGPGASTRPVADDPVRETRKGTSFSYFPQPGLRVTQILEIVPSKQPVDVGGQQRRLMDTMLVRYLFENTGDKAVNAGLRLEVDTLIGGNDGVPFTVPGRGLINTSADFTRPQDVPDFVQALETGSLRSPGTIVHISLKVGAGIEAPSRVTLCHWASNGDLSNIRATNMGTDSAIIMVWPDQNLPAGARREMGYAYGLGSVTAADPGGTLAVTLGGNFDIGQSFTITAYVNKPVAGQTLELDLPPGLERIKGDKSQRVPAPTVKETSIISWEAKVQQPGVFPVKVRSSTGVTQTKTVSIVQGTAPTGGKLAMDLEGPFEPGKIFRVVGKVSEPIANQTLSLQLPAGLERTGGEATQRVPAPAAGSKDAVVDWQVRVKEPGKYPVRVSSSTGVAQTKTITIVQPGRAEGLYQILLTGDFTPGKVFTVSTKVVNPAPDQKLTLVLPKGLQQVEGAETQTAQPGAPMAWKVKIEETGRFMVGVKSTTGVTQRKTIIIEPPGDEGGRFTFDLEGDIRPDKEFRVIAQVAQPMPGQTLTLVLPKGLSLADGAEVQRAAAKVVWSVRVTASGRLPVRIESSTGLARTKTINLTERNSLFGQ